MADTLRRKKATRLNENWYVEFLSFGQGANPASYQASDPELLLQTADADCASAGQDRFVVMYVPWSKYLVAQLTDRQWLRSNGLIQRIVRRLVGAQRAVDDNKPSPCFMICQHCKRDRMWSQQQPLEGQSCCEVRLVTCIDTRMARPEQA